MVFAISLSLLLLFKIIPYAACDTLTFNTGLVYSKTGDCGTTSDTLLGLNFFSKTLEDYSDNYFEFIDKSNATYNIKFNFTSLDDNCDASTHESLLGTLYQSGVDFLVGSGPSFSDQDANFANKNERLFYHCCVDPDTFYQNNSYVYSLHSPSKNYAYQTLKSVALGGFENLFIAYRSDNAFVSSPCEEIFNFVKEDRLQSLKIKGVRNYTAAEANSSTFLTDLVREVSDTGADAFFACDFTNLTTAMAATFAKAKYSLKILFLTMAPLFEDFALSLGTAADFVQTPVAWHPAMPYHDDFFGTAASYASNFKALYGANPSYFAAEASASLLSLSRAIQKALGRCNLSVANGDVHTILYGTDVLTCDDSDDEEGDLGQSPQCSSAYKSGYARIMDALLETGINTFFGPVIFNSTTKQNVVNRPATAQMISGELVCVEPVEFASGVLVIPQEDRFREPKNSVHGDSRVWVHALISVFTIVPVAVIIFLIYLRLTKKLRYRNLFGAVHPPGPGPETSLLVSDIQNSTLLWESLPSEVMDMSLQIHNSIMRSLLADHCGYESATEGDSFILAFHTALTAVQFAVAVQEALLSAPWPRELLAHPDGTVVLVHSKIIDVVTTPVHWNSCWAVNQLLKLQKAGQSCFPAGKAKEFISQGVSNCKNAAQNSIYSNWSSTRNEVKYPAALMQSLGFIHTPGMSTAQFPSISSKIGGSPFTPLVTAATEGEVAKARESEGNDNELDNGSHEEGFGGDQSMTFPSSPPKEVANLGQSSSDCSLSVSPFVTDSRLAGPAKPEQCIYLEAIASDSGGHDQSSNAGPVAEGRSVVGSCSALNPDPSLNRSVWGKSPLAADGEGEQAITKALGRVPPFVDQSRWNSFLCPTSAFSLISLPSSSTYGRGPAGDEADLEAQYLNHVAWPSQGLDLMAVDSACGTSTAVEINVGAGRDPVACGTSAACSSSLIPLSNADDERCDERDESVRASYYRLPSPLASVFHTGPFPVGEGVVKQAQHEGQLPSSSPRGQGHTASAMFHSNAPASAALYETQVDHSVSQHLKRMDRGPSAASVSFKVGDGHAGGRDGGKQDSQPCTPSHDWREDPRLHFNPAPAAGRTFKGVIGSLVHQVAYGASTLGSAVSRHVSAFPFWHSSSFRHGGRMRPSRSPRADGRTASIARLSSIMGYDMASRTFSQVDELAMTHTDLSSTVHNNVIAEVLLDAPSTDTLRSTLQASMQVLDLSAPPSPVPSSGPDLRPWTGQLSGNCRPTPMLSQNASGLASHQLPSGMDALGRPSVSNCAGPGNQIPNINIGRPSFNESTYGIAPSNSGFLSTINEPERTFTFSSLFSSQLNTVNLNAPPTGAAVSNNGNNNNNNSSLSMANASSGGISAASVGNAGFLSTFLNATTSSAGPSPVNPLNNSTPSQVGQAAETNATVLNSNILFNTLIGHFIPNMTSPVSSPSPNYPPPHSLIAFRGLRVRMGIHSGMNSDPISVGSTAKTGGRIQYSGAMLRSCKHVSDTAAGGMVILSDQCYRQLPMELLHTDTLVMCMGQHVIHEDDVDEDLMFDEGRHWPALYEVMSVNLLPRLVVLPEPKTYREMVPSILTAPIGHVTICFMNVVGSQTLGDWNPEIAAAAFSVFGKISSRMVREWGGYVVELTDSLCLAAFLNPYHAIMWALKTQRALIEHQWDMELLEHELCEEIAVVVPASVPGAYSVASASEYNADLPNAGFAGPMFTGAHLTKTQSVASLHTNASGFVGTPVIGDVGGSPPNNNSRGGPGGSFLYGNGNMPVPIGSAFADAGGMGRVRYASDLGNSMYNGNASAGGDNNFTDFNTCSRVHSGPITRGNYAKSSGGEVTGYPARQGTGPGCPYSGAGTGGGDELASRPNYGNAGFAGADPSREVNSQWPVLRPVNCRKTDGGSPFKSETGTAGGTGREGDHVSFQEGNRQDSSSAQCQPWTHLSSGNRGLLWPPPQYLVDGADNGGSNNSYNSHGHDAYGAAFLGEADQSGRTPYDDSLPGVRRLLPSASVPLRLSASETVHRKPVASATFNLGGGNMPSAQARRLHMPPHPMGAPTYGPSPSGSAHGRRLATSSVPNGSPVESQSSGHIGGQSPTPRDVYAPQRPPHLIHFPSFYLRQQQPLQAANSYNLSSLSSGLSPSHTHNHDGLNVSADVSMSRSSHQRYNGTRLNWPPSPSGVYSSTSETVGASNLGPVQPMYVGLGHACTMNPNEPRWFSSTGLAMNGVCARSTSRISSFRRFSLPEFVQHPILANGKETAHLHVGGAQTTPGLDVSLASFTRRSDEGPDLGAVDYGSHPAPVWMGLEQTYPTDLRNDEMDQRRLVKHGGVSKKASTLSTIASVGENSRVSEEIKLPPELQEQQQEMSSFPSSETQADGGSTVDASPFQTSQHPCDEAGGSSEEEVGEGSQQGVQRGEDGRHERQDARSFKTSRGDDLDEQARAKVVHVDVSLLSSNTQGVISEGTEALSTDSSFACDAGSPVSLGSLSEAVPRSPRGGLGVTTFAVVPKNRAFLSRVVSMGSTRQKPIGFSPFGSLLEAHSRQSLDSDSGFHLASDRRSSSVQLPAMQEEQAATSEDGLDWYDGTTAAINNTNASSASEAHALPARLALTAEVSGQTDKAMRQSITRTMPSQTVRPCVAPRAPALMGVRGLFKSYSANNLRGASLLSRVGFRADAPGVQSGHTPSLQENSIVEDHEVSTPVASTQARGVEVTAQKLGPICEGVQPRRPSFMVSLNVSTDQSESKTQGATLTPSSPSPEPLSPFGDVALSPANSQGTTTNYQFLNTKSVTEAAAHVSPSFSSPQTSGTPHFIFPAALTIPTAKATASPLDVATKLNSSSLLKRSITASAACVVAAVNSSGGVTARSPGHASDSATSSARSSFSGGCGGHNHNHHNHNHDHGGGGGDGDAGKETAILGSVAGSSEPTVPRLLRRSFLSVGWNRRKYRNASMPLGSSGEWFVPQPSPMSVDSYGGGSGTGSGAVTREVSSVKNHTADGSARSGKVRTKSYFSKGSSRLSQLFRIEGSNAPGSDPVTPGTAGGRRVAAWDEYDSAGSTSEEAEEEEFLRSLPPSGLPFLQGHNQDFRKRGKNRTVSGGGGNCVSLDLGEATAAAAFALPRRPAGCLSMDLPRGAPPPTGTGELSSVSRASRQGSALSGSTRRTGPGPLVLQSRALSSALSVPHFPGGFVLQSNLFQSSQPSAEPWMVPEAPPPQPRALSPTDCLNSSECMRSSPCLMPPSAPTTQPASPVVGQARFSSARPSLSFHPGFAVANACLVHPHMQLIPGQFPPQCPLCLDACAAPTLTDEDGGGGADVAATGKSATLNNYTDARRSQRPEGKEGTVDAREGDGNRMLPTSFGSVAFDPFASQPLSLTVALNRSSSTGDPTQGWPLGHPWAYVPGSQSGAAGYAGDTGTTREISSQRLHVGSSSFRDTSRNDRNPCASITSTMMSVPQPTRAGFNGNFTDGSTMFENSGGMGSCSRSSVQFSAQLSSLGVGPPNHTGSGVGVLYQSAPSISMAQTPRQILMRGLRVKVGIDVGSASSNLHPTSGHVAYRGRVLNRAARVGAMAGSNQVLCSAKAWLAAEHVTGNEASLFIQASSLGLRSLKGVAHPVEVIHCTYRDPDMGMLSCEQQALFEGAPNPPFSTFGQTLPPPQQPPPQQQPQWQQSENCGGNVNNGAPQNVAMTRAGSSSRVGNNAPAFGVGPELKGVPTKGDSIFRGASRGGLAPAKLQPDAATGSASPTTSPRLAALDDLKLSASSGLLNSAELKMFAAPASSLVDGSLDAVHPLLFDRQLAIVDILRELQNVSDVDFVCDSDDHLEAAPPPSGFGVNPLRDIENPAPAPALEKTWSSAASQPMTAATVPSRSASTVVRLNPAPAPVPVHLESFRSVGSSRPSLSREPSVPSVAAPSGGASDSPSLHRCATICNHTGAFCRVRRD